MQTVKRYAPWIAALAGSGAIANAGYVLNAALNMDSSNIVVFAQALVSLLLGLGGVGYAAKSSGGQAVTTYADDTEAVQHLAAVCKGCKEAEKALQTINSRILDREMEPDA